MPAAAERRPNDVSQDEAEEAEAGVRHLVTKL